MNILTDSLSTLALICAPILLLTAGFVLTLESGVLAGLVLPGSSTVVLVGALVGSGRLPFVPSMIVLVLASTLGAQYGFRVSRRHASIQKSPRFVGITKHAKPIRERAQRQFASNASIGTILAHLIGGTRTFGPRLAAGSPLSYRKFALLNAIAAAMWVNVLLVTGALVGTAPTILPWLLGALLVAALTAGVLQHNRNGRLVMRPEPIEDPTPETRKGIGVASPTL